jgi:hypothetical protein
MKRYELGATDLAQYSGLTEAERLAWLNPQPDSYHSFHIERMGESVFRWRDSRSANFYVGTHEELCEALLSLTLRRLNPNSQRAVPLTLLSQEEIDDLFSDL